MKPFILVCDGMNKEIFAELQKNELFDVYPHPKNSQETIAENLPKAQALIIRSSTKITPEILEQAPQLKLVIRAGEGTDNIDKAACAQRGVCVENTPGANNNSAAEHAIALMMTALRHTAKASSTLKKGGWDKSKFTGLELSHKKVGIVGFGRIGQILAKRISGFEPTILFYDPFIEKSDLPYVQKASSLEEIFSTCDIITLHTPLVKETRHLINAKLFELMSPQSILINASRGGIVHEDSLYTALSQKKIYAAALDVFASEPLEKDSPLRGLENIILTPHLGASTEEAQLRVAKMVVHQLEEFFNHNNPLNEVRA